MKSLHFDTTRTILGHASQVQLCNFDHSNRYSFNSLSLPPSQPSRPSAIVRFKPCVRRELLHQLVVLLRNLLLMLAEAMLEDLNAEHDLEAELFVIIITMIKGGGGE